MTEEVNLNNFIGKKIYKAVSGYVVGKVAFYAKGHFIGTCFGYDKNNVDIYDDRNKEGNKFYTINLNEFKKGILNGLYKDYPHSFSYNEQIDFENYKKFRKGNDMSILEEYEQIKKQIGEDKWNSIDTYIKYHHPNLRLDHIIYNKDRYSEFNNWYYENIKNYKVKIDYAWKSDYGDIKCCANIYKNDLLEFSVVGSYKGPTVVDDFDVDSEYEEYFDKKTINILKSFIYDDINKYEKLIKRSECSNLLQEIYDSVFESEVSMCHIDYDDWNDYYSEKFTDKDVDTLKKEIKKYSLQDVIEIDAHKDYKIIGYGNLETMIADDKYKGKKIYNIDDDLETLKICYEYNKIKNSLPDFILRSLNKSLERYMNSNLKTDDYKKIYGDNNLIDWYEGLMTTKDFINEYIDRNRFNFKDINKCVEILDNSISEVNNLIFNAKEKYDYILKEYDGYIDMIDEADDNYTIDVFNDYNDNSILATIIINKENGNIKVGDSFDIFNSIDDKFLSNYSRQEIEKNMEADSYDK